MQMHWQAKVTLIPLIALQERLKASPRNHH
jgi:hypothetical protein